jgi:hypothetical protein
MAGATSAGAPEGEEPRGQHGLVTNGERVLAKETLPCTGMNQAPPFEVFSAGPTPRDLPLTGTTRRCDQATPKTYGWPNNYVGYSYGDCEIPTGATGCSPPLTVQTWPACQRSEADYSLEGGPLPHHDLPDLGEAKVVEFTFPSSRIEVYTGATTIVIYAADRELARDALALLRPQPRGAAPATHSAALRGAPSNQLAPPDPGSIQGELKCQP